MPKMTPQDWIDEIDRSLQYRKAFAREEAWRKNEMNFLNSPASHAAIGPNLVFEMGDVLLSATGALDPEFTVVPEHPAGVQRAPIVESIDNNLSRKMFLRKHVNRAALHSYLYSRAIIKIGYDSEFGWSPRLDIGVADSPTGMSLSQFHPRSGKRIEFKNVNPGMPWVSSVLPHDIVVPWGTIDLEDSPWVAHRVIRLNDDLRADPKYINTSSLRPNMSMEDFVASYLNVGVDRTKYRETYRGRMTGRERPLAIYNELWEIHDRRDMKVKVVTKDHDKYLRNEIDAIMLVCSFPFVSGTFVDHPRSFWGTPLAYYLGQLQSEQYDISVQAAKQRRLSILKFIASKGLMSAEKMQRLISGDVGAFEIADLGEDLRNRIVTMPTGNYFDFIAQGNSNRQDARSLIGFSRNQAGEFDVGTRRTKGEAMLVAQGSYRRESPRVQMIRDIYLGTMEKINQIIFSYWTSPRPVLVDREWVRFTGDEIKGDYLYDLSLAAKRDLSKAERKVEALMLLSQIGPMLQGIDPKQSMEYLANAANDPAFENLLGFVRGQGGRQQGSQGAQQ